MVLVVVSLLEVGFLGYRRLLLLKLLGFFFCLRRVVLVGRGRCSLCL